MIRESFMTLDFWDTWGMFQGSVGIFLDGESLSSFTYRIYLRQCFGTAMYCPKNPDTSKVASFWGPIHPCYTGSNPSIGGPKRWFLGWTYSNFQGTMGCTPNSVPMVFIGVFYGFLGIMTHKYPLYRAYIGISHRGTLVGVHPTITWNLLNTLICKSTFELIQYFLAHPGGVKSSPQTKNRAKKTADNCKTTWVIQWCLV